MKQKLNLLIQFFLKKNIYRLQSDYVAVTTLKDSKIASNQHLEDLRIQIEHLTQLNKKETEKSNDFMHKYQKV